MDSRRHRADPQTTANVGGESMGPQDTGQTRTVDEIDGPHVQFDPVGVLHDGRSHKLDHLATRGQVEVTAESDDDGGAATSVISGSHCQSRLRGPASRLSHPQVDIHERVGLRGFSAGSAASSGRVGTIMVTAVAGTVSATISGTA